MLKRLRAGSIWILTSAFAGCGGDGGNESGAESAQALSSDFTPPNGRATGPADSHNGYGPWSNRLMIAKSSDGLNFTRTNQIVTDQGDVPDLVLDSNGRIYLYYVGWTAGDRTNALCVALSDDSGESWVYKYVELTGFEGTSQPVDPDVQILEDGTFRAYLTAAEPGKDPHTWYAEGSDGIHFTNRGSAFEISGTNVLDPSTIRIGSTWHIFAGGGGAPQHSNRHGTSADGTSFVYEGDVTLLSGSEKCMAANAIAVPGGYRIYGFTMSQPARIASFFTTDGGAWTAEEGNRLELDSSTGLEAEGVKDPAVVRLKDGTYLMVYVTGIPE